MSQFSLATLAPADPIFGLVKAFKEDKRPEKLSFVVGYYQDADGKTPVMRAVRKAEEELTRLNLSKEYLPIEGHAKFLELLGRQVLGAFADAEKERIVGVQTVGGTGALRLAGDFLHQQLLKEAIWVSDPTWPNHRQIFARAHLTAQTYPYYFEKMRKALEKLPAGSLVLLHACCHNPSGLDLTKEQWLELAEVFEKGKLFPFFDMAYQGFGQSPEEDAMAVRLFAKKGLEMAIAYSCAKNFSLYGERVGALFFIANSSKVIENVRSQLRVLVRTTYSNPPLHGAEIVTHILASSSLKEEWLEELAAMRERMKERRVVLADLLGRDSIRQGRGLFCFSGLKPEEVQRLQKEFAIYMPSDGRLNVTALTEESLKAFMRAIR